MTTQTQGTNVQKDPMLKAHAGHVPVMCAAVLEKLAPFKGHMVDATFGRGGYTHALLQQNPELRITAFDRDPEAIAFGQQHFKSALANGRLTLIHARFSHIDRHISKACLDGIVFDFGVSSPQLEQAERGFSFQQDGPLDMRMGLTSRTAADLLNHGSEKLLSQTLWKLGGEKRARTLARKIVQQRQNAPFTRTAHVTALFDGIPQKTHLHPATRTFQALRMWTNEEEEEIEAGLACATYCLKEGGRFVSVAFHELEDRPVKHLLRPQVKTNMSRHNPSVWTDSPPSLFHAPRPQPLKPTHDEIQSNPRSRSAHLRWGIRCENASNPARTSLHKEEV